MEKLTRRFFFKDEDFIILFINNNLITIKINEIKNIDLFKKRISIFNIWSFAWVIISLIVLIFLPISLFSKTLMYVLILFFFSFSIFHKSYIYTLVVVSKSNVVYKINVNESLKEETKHKLFRIKNKMK